MGAMEAIDAVKAEGGRATALASYGSGIPSRGANTNQPLRLQVLLGSPHGLINSAKMRAAYLREGRTVGLVAELIGADSTANTRNTAELRSVSKTVFAMPAVCIGHRSGVVVPPLPSHPT